MESRIERLCMQQGLKMTGQRRVIARVLSEAEDHPDVEELYRRAAALDARISIATVYRTVRLLEAALEEPELRLPRAVALVAYHIRRNTVAKASHDKTWKEKHKGVSYLRL